MKGSEIKPQPKKPCMGCSNFLPTVRHYNRKFCSVLCRENYYRKYEYNESEKVKCLICGKRFIRIGNHANQTHKMTALEYKQEFGLVKKEMISKEFHQRMKAKLHPKSLYTLLTNKEGLKTRFKNGGNHPEVIKNFWKTRKSKRAYEELGTELDDRNKNKRKD